MAKDQMWRVWVQPPGIGAGLGLPKELGTSHWVSANDLTCLLAQPSTGPGALRSLPTPVLYCAPCKDIPPPFTLG